MLTISRMLIGKAGWLLLSFLCIVAVLALWSKLPAELREWQSEAENTERLSDRLQGDQSIFKEDAKKYQRFIDREIRSLSAKSGAQLSKAERNIMQRQQVAQGHVLNTEEMAWAIATGRPERLTASYRAKLIELPLLDRALQAVRLRKADLQIASLNQAMASHRAKTATFNARVRERNQWQRQARGQRRTALCRRVDQLPGCDLVRQLRQRDDELRAERAALKRESALLRARKDAADAGRRGRGKIEDGALIVARALEAYEAEARRVSERAGDHVLNQAKDALARHSRTAAWLVVCAVVLPVLLKLLTFLVIAPLAARSRPMKRSLLLERATWSWWNRKLPRCESCSAKRSLISLARFTRRPATGIRPLISLRTPFDSRIQGWSS